MQSPGRLLLVPLARCRLRGAACAGRFRGQPALRVSVVADGAALADV